MVNIQLVSAKAGLTNYYNDQVLRAPVIDINSTIIDQLTMENHSGGISGSTLNHAAVMAGGLNAQASGFATIAGGGFGESKGLMFLTFMTKDSPVQVEYMHVIGYITNNASTVGITQDAIFHPSMSWKTEETITSSMGGLGGPATNINRKYGHRVDYMYNDGSNMANNAVSLRPTDVIDYAMNESQKEATMQQLEDEGMLGVVPQITTAGSTISRAGLVMSKRQNINPSSYAKDILVSGTNYQRNAIIGANAMDAGNIEDAFSGMYGELSQLSYQASNREPQIQRDEFFRAMMETMGHATMRGFTGYTIRDLMMCFGNLDEVLDLVTMDANQFTINDYRQTSQAFGTSSPAEIIATEIEVNILDLLTEAGISGISLRGSNCDTYGENGNGNIVILPYNPASLTEDDMNLGQKAEMLADKLRSQILTKLNGTSSSMMTPIRFEVESEMFGTTTVNIQIVDQGTNAGFSFDESGNTSGMLQHSFPTYAINATSHLIGDSESAIMAGSNFFSNIESYFKY